MSEINDYLNVLERVSVDPTASHLHLLSLADDCETVLRSVEQELMRLYQRRQMDKASRDRS